MAYAAPRYNSAHRVYPTSRQCQAENEPPLYTALVSVFTPIGPDSRDAVFVKSFGRRQAYESPRGRNPRATGDGYGDFGFRQMSAMARPPSGSSGVNADRPLRCASARCCRDGRRLGAALSASIITIDARRSVAGGWGRGTDRDAMRGHRQGAGRRSGPAAAKGVVRCRRAGLAARHRRSRTAKDGLGPARA